MRSKEYTYLWVEGHIYIIARDDTGLVNEWLQIFLTSPAQLSSFIVPGMIFLLSSMSEVQLQSHWLLQVVCANIVPLGLSCHAHYFCGSQAP